MREAHSSGRQGAEARGAGARGRRPGALARAALLLAACASLTACPPDGGDLVPVSGGGATVATKRFEGDTLSVTRDGVALSASGRWSVADASTSVILEASNANAEPAAIHFGRAELSPDGGGHMTLRSVSRGSGGAPDFLADKRAELGGGQAATFVLEYRMESGDGRSGVPRDVTGQVVTLRLPVVFAGRTTAEADFVFAFRYAGRRQR